jgi:hypothetical protein
MQTKIEITSTDHALSSRLATMLADIFYGSKIVGIQYSGNPTVFQKTQEGCIMNSPVPNDILIILKKARKGRK